MNGIDRANKLNTDYGHEKNTETFDAKTISENDDNFDNVQPKSTVVARKVKKCGWLHKKGDDKFNAQWKKRWFVVRDDCVFYYTKPDSEKPNGCIKLKDVFVARAEESKRKKTHPWTFKIYNPNAENSRVYYLYADSANTESVWIKWIREEINRVNGKSFGSTEDNLIDLDQCGDSGSEFGNVDDNNKFGSVDDTNELGNPFNDNINNNDNEKNATNEDGDKGDGTDSVPQKARSTLSNFSNMY
jgi:hypothetical protein